MDIVNRLKQFMSAGNIAISQFADTCGIPRPTLSQILNGRNKKISDELITKIHLGYPELSVVWLLFGEGEMGTVANMQFSEPKNPAENPDSGQFASENQKLAKESSSFETANLFDQSVNDKAPADDIQLPFGASTHQMQENRGSMHAVHSEIIDFGETVHGLGSDASNDRRYAENRSSADIPGMQSTVKESVENQKDGGVNNESREVSLITPSNKIITNIVVFYSDNSFQSFSPSPAV